jgi:hypothetical protein
MNCDFFVRSCDINFQAHGNKSFITHVPHFCEIIETIKNGSCLPQCTYLLALPHGRPLALLSIISPISLSMNECIEMNVEIRQRMWMNLN